MLLGGCLGDVALFGVRSGVAWVCAGLQVSVGGLDWFVVIVVGVLACAGLVLGSVVIVGRWWCGGLFSFLNLSLGVSCCACLLLVGKCLRFSL